MILNPHKKTVILTGAGISADSGIPTFRDPQDGLWAEYDPEDLATTRAFDKDPRLVLDWYDWRRKKVLAAVPNAAHLTITKWQKTFENLTLITQNVDGLHQKAGSENVFEMHGSIHRMKCRKHGHKSFHWMETLADLPKCIECDSLMRPDIVWFGENLDMEMLRIINQRVTECEVFLAIGTSGIVYPAAGFIQKTVGARTIVVNIQKEKTGAFLDECWHGRAADILPQVEIKE